MTDPNAMRPPALDHLLTWRESSTSREAIVAAIGAAGSSVAARASLAGAGRVVLTGAGSSYYLALAAAAAAREATHRPFVAAPLSEILLRPAGVFVSADPATEAVVVISRSGSTSEAVAVATRARELGHPTIAVTCRADSPLAMGADVTLVSPAGDERAIVMTRSFASMLALLLRVIASVAGDDGLGADLACAAADHWADVTAAVAVGRRLGTTDWRRIVILGGGPAFGIAMEWGLKLTETSQVATNAYEPLEFRHGPISVCEPGVLVVGLIGGAGAQEEARVLAEAVALGAHTWVVARDGEEARGAPGDISLIGRGLHPTARLPLLLHPAHALALTLALTRGCDPDAPRHLDQVVILDAG